jgi:hypothetical protein
MTRRAGTGRLAYGGDVTWTVADGSRGRRWRSMLVEDGHLVGVLLLESAPDGALRKLELASAAGLLTLHPERDTLHGNVVRRSGVEHVTVPWRPDAILLVGPSPATAGVAARQLASSVGVGEGRSIVGLLVGIDLAMVPTTFRVARVGERRWRFVAADTGAEAVAELDDDGIPILPHAESWPLELAHDH